MKTNKILKYYILIIITIASLYMFGQTMSCNKKKKFKDFYDIEDIYKAEMSFFKKNNYITIKNYSSLINQIKCSKIVSAKFIPKIEVKFYKSNKTIYTIYFSETFRYFKIDGRTFVIDKKKSKKIFEILNSIQ